MRHQGHFWSDGNVLHSLREFGATCYSPLLTLTECYMYDFYISFRVNFTLRTGHKHLTLVANRHSVVFPAEVN